MSAPLPDVPDLLLERLLAGDLPKERADELRRRVEQSPDAKARLDALRRQNDEILLTHPPREVVPEIHRRAGVQPARTRSWLAIAMPLAVGAAALAFVVRPVEPDLVRDPASLSGPDQTQLKGDPIAQLRVYRRVGTSVEQLEPGATARGGDTLQLAYAAFGNGFGIIFSIDGAGGVTLHYPEHTGQAQKLLPSGEISLPHAYQLDDAPDYERFFIVAADAPIDVDAVLGNARALAKDKARAARRYLDLPDGMRQYSFTVRKEQR